MRVPNEPGERGTRRVLVLQFLDQQFIGLLDTAQKSVSVNVVIIIIDNAMHLKQRVNHICPAVTVGVQSLDQAIEGFEIE